MTSKMVGPFHGHYKPCSRIILLSNDGQKFALDRFLLTKNSGFFRHLFELPRPTQRHGQPAGQAKIARVAGKTKKGIKEDDQKKSEAEPPSDLIKMASESSATMSPTKGETEQAVGAAEIEEKTAADPHNPEIDNAGADDEGWGLFELEHGSKTAEDGEPKTASLSFQRVKSVPSWAQAEPLEVDVGWQQLAEFLDMLKIAQYIPAIVSAEHLAIGMTQIRSVLPLAKKYDCPKLLSALTARLKAIAAKDPWSVLFLASDLDDTAVARLAIALFVPDQHFHNGGFGRSSGYLKEQLEKLRQSWQLALMKVLLPTTCHSDIYRHGSSRLVSVLEIDMAQVAASFNPSAEELPPGFTALPSTKSSELVNLV